ncbi:hypothetical protein BCR44DRAFT_1154406 [Catenaria anguillulae PL171]|uniref:Homeobox domain-containing protein n=1 Tax=Catenaria anguillulae PL171 TaxID=765915 RepID=A0A1Y2HIT8_9FUNG|nr:hypothetical protein BCR44DRAFT_1154406 [Catenaria anguillulae PL171]
MSNGVPPFLGHHVPSPADLSRALSQLPQYHQDQQPLQQPMPLQMQFNPAPPSHQHQQISPQPFDFVQQQFFGANGNATDNGNQLTIDTHAASQYTGPSSFTAPHLRGLSGNSAASPTTAGTPESLTAAATPTSATTPTLPHLSGGETLPSGASSAGSNNGGSSSSVSVPKRRPRATPDQLKILEETFLQTTSPNAQLRADLANRLSMTERSVQIWFQNKRAKVKNAQRKSQQEIQETAARAQMAAAYGVAAMGGPGAAAAMGWPAANGGASPMGSPFVHAPGIASPAGALDASAGMAGPMELLGSYLFSVDSLTVGTWRRAAQYSARSLFCAYALSHQLFTWTITDNNYTFKMEMPFQNVSQLVMQCVPPPPPPTPPSVPVSPTTEGMAAQVAAAAAAQSQPQAELVITLTQAPMFWMQVDTPTGKLWTQCNDFTENRQADTHLVHKLRGPPDALRAQVANLVSSDAALRERTTVEDPNRPGTMYSGDQALQVLPTLLPQGIAPAAAGQLQQQPQQPQQQGPQAIAARPPGVPQHAQHPAVRTLVNRPRRSASAPMPPSFRSSPSAPSPLGGPALMPGLEHLSQQQQQQQMQLQQPFQHHQQAGVLQQDQRTFTAPHLRNQSQPNQYMAGATDPSVFQVPANAPPMPNASLAMASPYNMMDLSQLSATSASAPSSQQDFSSSSASVSASASPMVATNRPGRSNSDPAHVNMAAINPPPPIPMPPASGDLFGDVFGLSTPMDHSQLTMYSFGNPAAAEGCDPNHGGGQHQHQHQAQPMMMMPQHQQSQDHHNHQQQQQTSQGQQHQQPQQQQQSSSAEFDMLMSSLVNV